MKIYPRKTKAASKSPYKVRFQLIDIGSVTTVTSSSLDDEEFKLLDPLVIDLRILNLAPLDNDESWDRESSVELEKVISEKKNIAK
jgi:hypothetical protein